MNNEAEAETEDFTDELSDEALDRGGAKLCCGPGFTARSTR
jgi:hypothetical protein